MRGVSNKHCLLTFFIYLLVFFPVFSSRPLSQTKDFCGHFKVFWDNHPSCANCFHCSRQNTCEICCSWPMSTWFKFNRDVLTSQDGKKKSAPAEMFGVDDLSDHGGSTIVHHTNNQGAYHLRMIPYRSTVTNRTGLGRNEGEVSAVHLHRDPVFLTGKFDPILHRTDSPVNDLWVNLPVKSTGHRRDRTGQKSPTKSTEPDRTGPNWVSISRRVHRSRDRTGPNWVSISRRVHRSRNSRAIYRSKDVRLVYRSAQTVFCTTWKNSNGANVIH